jgi:hypothetical protein
LSWTGLKIYLPDHDAKVLNFFGEISSVVASTTMQIKVQVHGKWIKCVVRRRQFPITAAYAFTDYWFQGQILPYVLVDIAPPLCGTLTLFNLYVALSISSGQSTIRLLQDFDKDLFMQCHDMALIEEDES